MNKGKKNQISHFWTIISEMTVLNLERNFTINLLNIYF